MLTLLLLDALWVEWKERRCRCTIQHQELTLCTIKQMLVGTSIHDHSLFFSVPVSERAPENKGGARHWFFKFVGEGG